VPILEIVIMMVVTMNNISASLQDTIN